MTLLDDIKKCEARLEASRQATIKQAQQYDIDPYMMQDTNGALVIVPILAAMASCHLARSIIESEKRARNKNH